MQIVMIHGYFLKGTGSNLFVKNACRELCRMGHQVLLFCQENDTRDIDFIETCFEYDRQSSRYSVKDHKGTPYPGKCSLYRPDLQGFLPVYVYDQYAGYRVKAYTDCTREEIENYLECNREAINCAIKDQPVDLVWSNHSIMQPVYGARSELSKRSCPHVMTVHGSCLNFSVRKSPLLKAYALEAISRTDQIAFVSQFSCDEFFDFFERSPGIQAKSRVIPAGVDLDKFQPLAHSGEKIGRIQSLMKDLEKMHQAADENPPRPKEEESSWQTDQDVLEKLRSLDFENDKIILYYGKYLWTKGIHLLIAAFPLVLQKYPQARLVFVGYGSSRPYFEALSEALELEERDRFIELLENPQAFDAQMDRSGARHFKSLIRMLGQREYADAYFRTAARRIRSRILFTGFLGHDHLKDIIPCADIAAAPSIFPEAFGLVAVESLASGVFPLLTNNSGFAEVTAQYADEFAEIFEACKLKPLDLDEALSLNLAYDLIAMLDFYQGMGEADRNRIRQSARKISEDHYSWISMVNSYLEMAVPKQRP